MRVISAFMLAVLGGNTAPTVADITKILDAAGVEADAARIEAFLKDVEGKSVDELIKAGEEKLASVVVAGGASKSGSGSGSGSGSAAKSGSGSGSGSGSSSAKGGNFNLFD